MKAISLAGALGILLAAAHPAKAQHDPHADHRHHHGPGSQPEAPAILSADDAPPAPTDHAADRYFDPAEMARARKLLAHENGSMPISVFRIERLERRVIKGRDGYHWEAEGSVGGDIDRFAFKTKGEGAWKGGVENAEVQALYSRAIDPYFNLRAGLRHDFRPSPRRSYAVVAVEGLAPYWFEIEAEAFLSDRGDAHFRLEASYDQRITQRWIVQPQIEINFAAQDVPRIGVGAGLSSLEAGLRLRYEIVREFAPYVGLSWERKSGDTARLARAEGEKRQSTALAIGVSAWF